MIRWLSQVAFAATAFVLLSVCSGCRQDMQDQPRYKPLEKSSFFADSRSVRPIPIGTIARGHLNDNDAFHTGVERGVFLDVMPLNVNRATLDRGRERFNIYCSVCHGATGDGNGIVAKRGFKWPANLLSARVQQAPPGYLYQVITYGYGAMPDYASQIHSEDRWAIVAYLRALQLSRNARIEDVPPDERTKLEKQP